MVFTLGSFVLVTVAVAFVSWLKTKGTDETSKDGYFLGGRSLSGLVIFGSLMMTNRRQSSWKAATVRATPPV